VSRNTVVLLLALLLGTQPITTDLYLPALPAIAADLNTTMPSVQLTLTALLLSFGLSQLFWGPLSDRVGRKPVLVAGLTLYSAAAVACFFASGIDQLIVWRTVQGVGMGAAVVCGRALLRDLYAPEQAAPVMAAGMGGLGIIACASGPLGGAIAQWADWRTAMVALTIFGTTTLGVVLWRATETLKNPNPQALQAAVLLANWRLIASHPTFWAWALLATSTYGGLFTFLAAGSFVYMGVLGLSKAQYGLVLLASSGAYIAGTYVCRWQLRRLGMQRAVKVAACFSVAGTVLVAAFAHAGWINVWTMLLPWLLYMLAHGTHQPVGQSGVAGPFPHAAGAAAALAGVVMMSAAFGVGWWLGWRLDGTVWPLVHGSLLWSGVLAFVAWVLVQRIAKP
jgi:DHA1 family bicyclomycin/chloramphenicol resistance-like MFS transporter